MVIELELPVKVEKSKKVWTCDCEKCNGKEVSRATFYNHRDKNNMKPQTHDSSEDSITEGSDSPSIASPTLQLGNLDDLIPDSLKNITEPESPEDIRLKKKESIVETKKVGVALEGIGESVSGIIAYMDTIPIGGKRVVDITDTKQRKDALKKASVAIDKFCKDKNIIWKGSPEAMFLIAMFPVALPYGQLIVEKKNGKADKDNKVARQKFKAKYGMEYEDWVTRQERGSVPEDNMSDGVI